LRPDANSLSCSSSAIKLYFGCFIAKTQCLF
jgi:hypothetical protein